MAQQLFSTFIERLSGLIDTDRAAPGAPPRTLWSFMRWCLEGSWPILAIAAVISAATGASEVLTMYILGRIVDIAGSGAPLSEAFGLLILGSFLVLGLRPILFGLNAAFQSVVIGPNVFTLALGRLHRWTLGQAITFFDNDYAGRLAQKQMQASRSLTEIVVETVNAVIFGLSSVLGAAILVVAIDWRLLLILLGWLALYFFYLRVMLPKIRSRSKARAAAQAMVTGQVVDTITNIRTVKLFAGREHEDKVAIGAMEDLRSEAVYFGEISTLFRFGLMALSGLLPVGLVGAGLLLRDTGVSPGDIAASGAVAIRLAQMSGWISFTLMAIYSHVGEVEDGMNTLTPPHQLVDAPSATELEVPRGEIRFEDVSFAYGRRSGGITHVGLTISPGEKLGVVGASGAGKSTLVALLLRLYDPEEGRVVIDGHDVSQVSQDSLRRNIGMVTQETAMFNRTARDNIRYGRPGATDAEVEEAARKAEASEFIAELRDFRGRSGYDAFLGERGVKLSGGQRQRIALARALLKDAPILVLDEATSALDSEVEASIQAALETAMEGKTVIAIAHRLSTISSMDRIVVLEAGQIVEQGTHDDLLASGGVYARYWNRQSGGFIQTQDAAE
ncbi:ABC transporter ATP-binding protein [Ponticoccus sp. SC2-23]|uniref:ABC transporter ATP-binding protein n=1 Tax=Alexandriicola marinus TaxID=2081710 RepID=UPI000FD97C24|nr:ABC transporter ATP-binding protein [Alexandriicola marinus]MBM1220701.1 ABC transporter ATP-binding protein [Ponticoccus sp. SC6-9]MBM1225960.1 ABC transporter ATP-binding protein [Ponticoccus sp. SC6-15]MBM1231257.1 ABC transporter ATP-binding protein [Ponticoccus sp. SC6-38]MBM1235882.1 ABC transporter ATP-binding protein [Ponticoccus sp. SC6-45]MBM1240280.1 ABC transporter ATP-binding protein [Ponticoccus sp. SC6-49]MBM1244815.1 ABC transporter ATP-binding protein [Ponticoccus sp. SC2-